MEQTRKRDTALADWLTERMDARGIGGRELSRRTGASSSSVVNWLRGGKPEPHYWLPLAGALDVDPAEIARRCGYDPPCATLPGEMARQLREGLDRPGFVQRLEAFLAALYLEPLDRGGERLGEKEAEREPDEKYQEQREHHRPQPPANRRRQVVRPQQSPIRHSA